MVGAYIAAAQQGLKFIGGIAQFIKGNRMDIGPRPVAKTPEGLLQNKAIAQNQLNARMVGAAAAEENIKGNLANTAQAASNISANPAQALAVLSASNNDANQSFANLAVQEAADTQREQGVMMGVNNQLASDEIRRFNVNEMDPYMERAAAKNALIQGGMTNMFGAMGDGASLAMSGAFEGGANDMVTVRLRPEEGGGTGQMTRMQAKQSGYPIIG